MTITDENDLLKDALIEMVEQHCGTPYTSLGAGMYSTGAISAHEQAIYVLEALGVFVKVSERPDLWMFKEDTNRT